MQTTGLQEPAGQTAANLQQARTVKHWHSTTCKCGETVIASNLFSSFCNGCEKIVCVVDNCRQRFTSERSLYVHQTYFHSNPVRCYGCKTLKPQRRGLLASMKCPVCGSIWCLINNCGYQNIDSNNILIHQAKKHKTIVI